MRFPWRRGVLLVGPPGTGKTMVCKAAAARFPEMPFLYVGEIGRRNCIAEIEQVFEHARKSAPCILAFEDMDGLVDNANRTVFLNELDGFAANTGIVTLATTNHPERLDPAIVETGIAHRQGKAARQQTCIGSVDDGIGRVDAGDVLRYGAQPVVRKSVRRESRSPWRTSRRRSAARGQGRRLRRGRAGRAAAWPARGPGRAWTGGRTARRISATRFADDIDLASGDGPTTQNTNPLIVQ